MEPEIAKLLLSIEADRLVVICGAGLSMAEPSKVPSAAELAVYCSKEYLKITGESVPQQAEHDLEKLTQHFIAMNAFESVFIRKLIIPMRSFSRYPNKGHFAIADFLAGGAIQMCVSTNVDLLIDEAARELGEPVFIPALDGDEANIPRDHKPFLKIHGCLKREAEKTLWCSDQLSTDPLRRRIETSKTWLTANLRQRDLIFVGFWTDWAYLNEALLHCLESTDPNMIFLVDPEKPEVLQTKAPILWNLATRARSGFKHIQTSGDSFLDELRKYFCLQFIKKLLSDSQDSYRALSKGGSYHGDFDFLDPLSTGDLYALRRDACGIPQGEIVRQKNPDNKMSILGAIHLLLLSHGASINGHEYTLEDKRIRVVQGAGEPLSIIKSRFMSEPSSPIKIDIVICVSAFDDGGIADIVRDRGIGNVIRGGSPAEWMVETKAIEVLGLNL